MSEQTRLEATLCCMIVSNPAGGERPKAWQKRVNDLIRTQRNAIGDLQSMVADKNAEITILREALSWAQGCVPFPSDCHSQIKFVLAATDGAQS